MVVPTNSTVSNSKEGSSKMLNFWVLGIEQQRKWRTWVKKDGEGWGKGKQRWHVGQIDTWDLIIVYMDAMSQFSREFHGKLNGYLKVFHNSNFRYDIGMKKNLIYESLKTKILQCSKVNILKYFSSTSYNQVKLSISIVVRVLFSPWEIFALSVWSFLDPTLLRPLTLGAA